MKSFLAKMCEHASARPWAATVGVVVLALILRLVFLVQFRSSPVFDTPFMDMLYYHRWALAGLDGQPFVEDPYFKAPLYPWFLGVVYQVFGSGPWPIRLVQAVLGSITAGLTCLVAARLFDRRTGTVAGVIVALAGTLILFDAQLLAPSLTICLNMAGIFSLVRAIEQRRSVWFVLAGVALGLSALARPTVLLFALATIALLLWEAHRRGGSVRAKTAVLFAAGLIVVILPVTVRNYVTSGDVILISTYSGINLYIGNNLESDGVTTRIPGTGLDWWSDGTMEEVTQIAEQDAGRKLSPAEHSAYWRNRAVTEMREHPGFFLRHLGRKLLLLIGGLELFNNFDIYFVSHRTSLMPFLLVRDVIYVPWGIVLPLAVAGMLLVPKWSLPQRLALTFLLSSVPTLILFFVTSRYRLPMLPVLVLFAAFALVSGSTVLKRCSRLRRWSTLCVLVTLLVLVHIDFFGFGRRNDAQGHQMLAGIYQRRGDAASAERHYYRALDADSTLPHANNDLGLLLAERGQHVDALRFLHRAVRYEPNDFALQYNLGYGYLMAGQWSEATAQFSNVLQWLPDHGPAANNLGFAWLQLNRPDSALKAYRVLVTLHPDQPDALYSTGYCHHLLHRADSAEVYYRRALCANPEYGLAYYGLGTLWLETGIGDSSAAYLNTFLSLRTGRTELDDRARRVLDSLARLP